MIADIATEIENRGPALPDLAGECLQIVRFARENGDSVGRSEATDECGAESWSYAKNRGDLFVCYDNFSSE